jgi:hypothetical protein
MVAMNRDYGTSQSVYQNLLSQKEQSKLASSLERREIGEQFRLVDAARMPGRTVQPEPPSAEPDGNGRRVGRWPGARRAVRVSATALSKPTTTSHAYSGVPVLAVVPLMQSEQERRRAWQRRLASEHGARRHGLLLPGHSRVHVRLLRRPCTKPSSVSASVRST